jgi:hypothetical protein
MQTENKFYLGNIDWSTMFNSLPQNALFIIPNRDLIKVQNSLSDHNKNHQDNLILNQIYKISKKYTEQEEFYLVTFDRPITIK